MPRKPLEERSNSNAIRLVPSTPERLPGLRTPLPTHPSHILSPGNRKGKGKDTPALQYEFQHIANAQLSTTSTGPAVTTAPQYGDSATGSPIPKPKPVPKKRLHIHKDNKTFSLVHQDDSRSFAEDLPQSPKSPTLSTRSSSTSLHSNRRYAEAQSNSIISCDTASPLIGPTDPTTPGPDSKAIIPADPITTSPWNYEFVGGLRKVQKTPDLKIPVKRSEHPPLPDLPEISNPATSPASHDLSTKLSFQSTNTAPSTSSENTNYKVYRDDTSHSACEAAFAPPSSSDSNYQLLGDPSPASSVIYRPQTATDENENYELHGDRSPAASDINLSRPSNKYSQESLVVPPLKSRGRRSNENFGYYKSRSRESLRTGSLTSISTVLSQQEASQAIIGSGSLINLPVLNPKVKVTGSWAESLIVHPLRSPMNEHPHQWSSQLSTVHSVSAEGSDRGSRSWSDDNGRMSSGWVPSTPSRHSRQMLSISSLAQEEAGRNSLEAPQPAFARNGHRHHSSSSIPRMVGDQDEYGDGITDMQDLRARPSRTRLSGFFSVTSSDNGRTNTMRSTASSRANSMLASTIPTWARLYYGSGERRYLGAPGSSTEGTESRTNSLRSGSPNTDHFPLSIYSPRRRPREINAHTGSASQHSLEITPAPQLGSNGQLINDPYSGRFRTWSMSSIWSPHLRRDRRATRHSVWEPPSVNWSTEGGWFGRRNVQIVMFIMGFILPFSWMIAAFLPLPLNPMLEMREQENSTSNLDGSNDVPSDYIRQFGPMDEARYESAKWWRGLNRWMSMVGVLIIAVVIVLVVLSFTKRW